MPSNPHHTSQNVWAQGPAEPVPLGAAAVAAGEEAAKAPVVDAEVAAQALP